MSEDTSTRLNKFISESGFCSRREADRYIEEKRVTINGKTAKMGATVKAGDKVAVDGEAIKSRKPTDKPIYIAFNKPAGVTTTTDPKDKNNIIDFIGFPKRIFPIGRLDNPTEGLILLTNNGDIINKILRAGNNHDKEYIVTVDKPVTPEFVAKMSSGVRILETVTKPCFVQQQGKNVFKIVLTQGLNRQIRRMCEALDYKVIKLKRIRVMNIKLGDQPVGNWRYLTQEETETLHQLVAESVNTEDASYFEEAAETPQRPAIRPKPASGRPKGAPAKPKETFVNPKSASLRKKGAAGKTSRGPGKPNETTGRNKGATGKPGSSSGRPKGRSR
ncbi:23S rRNA pseudouridine(2604) synthase RluF [Pontibacter pamirensis]|uniref:23S rRNA pseudouridine(2604) synthase RluF n=1 Tax=Pontibacter pamirensis TaxID=2562824 RepID=UPI0013896524|nr:23S rRNA pseudouridine(2604) synthase RluF [Pontibacter pamirensis]